MLIVQQLSKSFGFTHAPLRWKLQSGPTLWSCVISWLALVTSYMISSCWSDHWGALLVTKVVTT